MGTGLKEALDLTNKSSTSSKDVHGWLSNNNNNIPRPITIHTYNCRKKSTIMKCSRRWKAWSIFFNGRWVGVGKVDTSTYFKTLADFNNEVLHLNILITKVPLQALQVTLSVILGKCWGKKVSQKHSLFASNIVSDVLAQLFNY